MRNPKMLEVPESHLITILFSFLKTSRTITSSEVSVGLSGGDISASELEDDPEGDDLITML